MPLHCFQIDRKQHLFLLNGDNTCSELSHWVLSFCLVSGEVPSRCRFSILNTPFYHVAGADFSGTE